MNVTVRLSGFACRCAERLCLSAKYFPENVRGCASNVGAVFLPTTGKAEPFRTSGGRAAIVGNFAFRAIKIFLPSSDVEC